MKRELYQIKLEAEKLLSKTDDELDIIAEYLRRSKGSINILPEWFALVQEISFRKIGLRHFDTQLVAGILLHQGNIVEMKTGEGKTLVSTLPASFNALEKKGVHIVTVNDYLAERDQKWMGKVYSALGLTIGLVKSTNTLSEKQRSYNADITYLTNSELVFDYLRDSSAYNVNEIVQRPFSFCLIDEIDSILIDEARTPLILSEPENNQNLRKLYLSKVIANFLEKNYHFELDEKKRDINLTEKGYEEAQQRVGKKTLYDPTDPWILDILNALKAKYLFKRNKDYIVLNNKIVIVDEFTGRIMEDRRWSMGLHESIEMKENIPVGQGTKTKSSITYQNFFTLYPKLSGMTGTAKTTEKEFQDIYNLNVVVLPPIKPILRKDLEDLVYQSELSKWKAVLEQSKKCFQTGQPILIGTTTIEKSEFLSELFQASEIPHQVLNAKPENVKRESEIISQAGERFAVTIATNMAGRGTDIILGGNLNFQMKKFLNQLLIQKDPQIFNVLEQYQGNQNQLEVDIENLPYSLDECKSSLKFIYNQLYKESYPIWQTENQKIKELGGLFVLGTERHETRRIDNQLRGRSGRQGDPGMSQFFVSLEDDLIKIFGGDNIRNWITYLVDDKDLPLEGGLLSKSLENAQKKIEMYNYDLRKNIFDYDNILNYQRKVLFKARKEILLKNLYEDLFLRYNEMSYDLFIQKKAFFVANFETSFGSYSMNTLNLKEDPYQELWITNDLKFAQDNFYEPGFLQNTKSIDFLLTIDFYWTEHLERMSYVRETISWGSYGQQNPLSEYNIQAFQSFKLMFKQIRTYMLYYF